MSNIFLPELRAASEVKTDSGGAPGSSTAKREAFFFVKF